MLALPHVPGEPNIVGISGLPRMKSCFLGKEVSRADVPLAGRVLLQLVRAILAADIGVVGEVGRGEQNGGGGSRSEYL
jgi:hypothetical protein